MRLQRVADEVAADEPGAAGDENLNHRASCSPLNPHFGVVAQHEAVRDRLERQAMNLHAAADQAVGHARLEIVNQRSLEHDAVLDLRLVDLDVLADRRERPDVGVDDARARRRSPPGRESPSARRSRPASITTVPSMRDVASTVPSIRGVSVSRISRLASSMSSSLPVSFHQPDTRCGVTRRPRSIRSWIASVISSSLRKLGLMLLDRVEDLRAEHVDADQRQVRLRLLRLFDQPHDLVAVRARRRRTSADRAPASAGSAPPASPSRTARRTRRCRG